MLPKAMALLVAARGVTGWPPTAVAFGRKSLDCKVWGYVRLVDLMIDFVFEIPFPAVDCVFGHKIVAVEKKVVPSVVCELR